MDLVHSQGLVTGDLGDEGRDLPGLLGALEELGGLHADQRFIE